MRTVNTRTPVSTAAVNRMMVIGDVMSLCGQLWHTNIHVNSNVRIGSVAANQQIPPDSHRRQQRPPVQDAICSSVQRRKRRHPRRVASQALCVSVVF